MQYEIRRILVFVGILPFVAGSVFSQEPSAQQRNVPIHLQVEAGTPLRLYITKRVPYRVGEIVSGKLLEPVWAFDRVVIPAGATMQGRVVKLDPVTKSMRARSMLNGDFTPLKHAQVTFQSLTLPDGHTLPLQTDECLGLPMLYAPPRTAKKGKVQKPPSAKPGAVRQFLQQQAQAQASAQSRGLYDLVRGPNKREWVENFLLSKLPYHPQWYRARTRFDALLTEPLDFGTVDVALSEAAGAGSTPPPDSIAQMRLLTTISSSDGHAGDPLQGVLSQPLFTGDHKLLLAQGTRFTGRITLAQHARLFHRGGKLRFTIEDVNPPEEEAGLLDNGVAATQKAQPAQAQLVAVEANPNAVKVDSEGTATATESKTRLLRPAIAALVAAKSLDNDSGKQTASGIGSPNTAGRSLGGFSGFGLLGTLAARGPAPVGAALGYYGLAWSVYSNVISRGNEVTFEKNTAVAIQFGSPRTK